MGMTCYRAYKYETDQTHVVCGLRWESHRLAVELSLTWTVPSLQGESLPLAQGKPLGSQPSSSVNSRPSVGKTTGRPPGLGSDL